MVYAGSLFVIVGIILIMTYLKQKRGEETWEGNHGIQIRKWWCAVLIIIGVLLTYFGESAGI